MKYLLVLIVVGVALWLINARRRMPPPGGGGGRTRGPAPPPRPQAMLACVHCGVHVPQGDVVADAAGRPYCSEAHRLAGPR